MAYFPPNPEQQQRVRLPRKGEVLGVVIQLMGGARMTVHCVDGKERMCRVPGKIKKQIWVMENDYVVIEPWSIEPDVKGDVVYRYTKVQVEQLRRMGVIKNL